MKIEMKKIYYSFLCIALLLFAACTDDFDDTNKNPNKVYDTSIDAVLPGIVYNSMRTINEMNFRWLATFAQYNAHWAEQKDTEDFNFFEGFYVKALTDLSKMEKKYSETAPDQNYFNIARTYKCYLYYILVTTYGNIPYTDANSEDILQSYKYDKQADIFKSLLETLDNVVSTFDINGSTLSRDPIFDGSIDKWRKFANSLRLQIAITAQGMDETLARTHIEKALTGENANYLLDTDAVFQFGSDLNTDGSWSYSSYMQKFETGQNDGWGTYPAMSHNFFLYMMSYDDPRLPKFAQKAEGDARCVLRNDTLTRVNPDYPQYRDTILVNYRVPYVARRDGKEQPNGWIVGTDPNDPNGGQYRSPFSNVTTGNPANECFVNYDFLGVDAIIPMLSVAEINFMKAEVAVKYPGILSGTAQQYYEAGIRASMERWGIGEDEITAYLERDGVKWDTDGNGMWEYRHFFKADINGKGGDANHLEQIWKQWYIADFYCGHAGWTLERRTRAMSFPPHFFNSIVPTQGSNGVCENMAERLNYPFREATQNTDAYAQGCSDLQSESPVPNPSRSGDNYFTLLAWAAPIPEKNNPDNWLGGEIVYDGSFVYHWYGSTLEEIYANTGTSTLDELKELIEFEVLAVKSTYDPVTGMPMEYDKETGTWVPVYGDDDDAE